nr:DUF3631 domain-containing protein [Streptomyces griseoviridis]
MREERRNALRDWLATWAQSVRHLTDGVFPDWPEGISDRSEDVWEAPLDTCGRSGLAPRVSSW